MNHKISVAAFSKWYSQTAVPNSCNLKVRESNLVEQSLNENLEIKTPTKTVSCLRNPPTVLSPADYQQN